MSDEKKTQHNDADSDELESHDDILNEVITDELAPSGDETDPGGGSLRQQLQDAEARVLRIQADLENYRKRARRELDEERKYAHVPIVRDLLPVMDNFDRALEALETEDDSAADDTSGMLQGVKMVTQQLHDVLRQYHCERIGEVGGEFDPAIHEAIAQTSSDEHPPGVVMQVTQPGYRIHDRVVRAAQVIVSRGGDSE